MNIPWKVSEQESSPVGAQANPVPTVLTAFGPVDVRGYDWVEFTAVIANNIGGGPITILDAVFEYTEATGPLAGIWSRLTVEDVGVSGVAPQEDYAPRRTVSGSAISWRIPIPVHGQQMRMLIKGNATPDPSSTLDVYAYRRSF